ncbi:hypothetical protein [Nocardia sp. NPDC052112]|uniref:hypothetical protein n=1 Tax=Nocardia sp. NPDC052112 TaxID=3155646 RepID=UPI00341AB80E
MLWMMYRCGWAARGQERIRRGESMSWWWPGSCPRPVLPFRSRRRTIMSAPRPEMGARSANPGAARSRRRVQAKRDSNISGTTSVDVVNLDGSYPR